MLLAIILLVLGNWFLGYKYYTTDVEYKKALSNQSMLIEDYSVAGDYVFCMWETIQNAMKFKETDCNVQVYKQEFVERRNKYYNAWIFTKKAYN